MYHLFHCMWLSAGFNRNAIMFISLMRQIHFHSKSHHKMKPLFFGPLSRHHTKLKMSFDLSLRKPGICLCPRRRTPNWGLILPLLLWYSASGGSSTICSICSVCFPEALQWDELQFSGHGFIEEPNVKKEEENNNKWFAVFDGRWVMLLTERFFLLNISGYFLAVCQCVFKALMQEYQHKLPINECVSSQDIFSEGLMSSEVCFLWF